MRRLKSLRNLPDDEITLRIVKSTKDGVVHALKCESPTTGLADARRRDKKMRRDRCAQESTPASFVIPALMRD
jgi:hypothetical protein